MLAIERFDADGIGCKINQNHSAVRQQLNRVLETLTTFLWSIFEMRNRACDRLRGGECSTTPRRKSSDIDALIGRRIRLRRTILGYTQAELASRCFLSPQQIHKYELGQSKLSAARLDQLARALEVSIGWFIDERPFSAEIPNDLLAIMSNPDAVMLLRLFNELDDNNSRELLVSLAKSVVRHRSLQPSDSDEIANSKSKTA